MGHCSLCMALRVHELTVSPGGTSSGWVLQDAGKCMLDRATHMQVLRLDGWKHVVRRVCLHMQAGKYTKDLAICVHGTTKASFSPSFTCSFLLGTLALLFL